MKYSYHVLIERLQNKKGGGGGGTVYVPQYVPPPAAPQATETATMTDAASPEEEAKRKADAIAKGAKSLQIPVTGGGTTDTVGTGQ